MERDNHVLLAPNAKAQQAHGLQANREHIVETASELFRERGFDGVGVADLMAAAAFTHGGFFKHFGSKADLMAEASARSLGKSLALAEPLDVPGFIDVYLSREHRDGRGNGCIRLRYVATQRVNWMK